METVKENQESAAAGKAGKPTAEKKEMTLNAAGVADVLKGELEASGLPEETPAKEIPTEEKTGAAKADEGNVELARQETPEEKAQRDEAEATEARELAERAEANGVTAEEQQEAETAEAAQAAEAHEAQLPDDAKAELDKWAETGGPLPPALQAVVGRRIGKLTTARDTEKARADKAEADLAKVTAEAEVLRKDPNRPTAAPPESIPDGPTLKRYEATAKQMVSDIENYLDDSATDEERVRVERFMESRHLDAKGLKRELRQTSAFLTQDLPKLETSVQQFRAAEKANEPVVKSRFPWLDAKDTPEYQKAQEVASFMPELRSRIPGHRAALGTWVVGLKVLEALNAAGHEGDALAALQPLLAKNFPPKNGKAKPAAAKTPPNKAPTHGSAPPVRPVARKDDIARAAFNKAPTRQNATELARAALMAS